jgi:hypothetical protein
MKFVLMIWETESFAHVSRLSFTKKKIVGSSDNAETNNQENWKMEQQE